MKQKMIKGNKKKLKLMIHSMIVQIFHSMNLETKKTQYNLMIQQKSLMITK